MDAYNNFLNGTAQPPSPWGYPQQAPRPAWQQPQQPPQPQPVNGIIRVTGIEGARAYPMGANSAQPLFDDAGGVFFIKTTDGAGFPTLKAYTYTDYVEATTPEAPAPEYITREEFEAFCAQLTAAKRAPAKKEATTDG